MAEFYGWSDLVWITLKVQVNFAIFIQTTPTWATWPKRENLMGQSRQAATRLVHALAHSVSFTFLSSFFFPKAGVWVDRSIPLGSLTMNHGMWNAVRRGRGTRQVPAGGSMVQQKLQLHLPKPPRLPRWQAPCLVTEFKILIFFPASRIKSRRNKKCIAQFACKSRDESN